MGHNAATAAYDRETERLRRHALTQDRRGRALRVVVLGGSTFDDRGTVVRVLDRLHRERGVIRLVTSETCKAQREAALWARARDVEWVYCAPGLLLHQIGHVVVAFGVHESVKRHVQVAGLPLWAIERRPSAWEYAARANADASRRSV